MQNTNLQLMESGSVSRTILKLAIPTVFSTIISIVYNLTDTYFIGMLDDPIQLGAISLAFPVFMILQAMGNLFGVGAPPYISRMLGAGSPEEAKRTSSVAVYFSAVVIILLSALCFLFMNPILHIIGTSADTFEPTKKYLTIVILFSVVIILQSLLPALLRAEGKVREAVIGMVIGTIINIILAPVFILYFRMGVSGAAWATVIGNVVAVVFYLFVFLKGDTMLSISPHDFKISGKMFGEVLKIGVPSSIALILNSATIAMFNNLAAGYGDYVVSAYGVAVKMTTMEYMIVFGYVSGYVPFASYNYGAGNMKRMLSALKFTLFSSTVISILFLIPFTVLAPVYMGAFSTDIQIIDIGTQFLRVQAWAVPIMGIQTCMMTTFQATGQGIRALVVNLGRQCLFYIPILYVFHALWGLNGLLCVQMASDWLTLIVAVGIAVPLLLKLRNMGHQQNQGSIADTEMK